MFRGYSGRADGCEPAGLGSQKDKIMAKPIQILRAMGLSLALGAAALAGTAMAAATAAVTAAAMAMATAADTAAARVPRPRRAAAMATAPSRQS